MAVEGVGKPFALSFLVCRRSHCYSVATGVSLVVFSLIPCHRLGVSQGWILRSLVELAGKDLDEEHEVGLEVSELAFIITWLFSPAAAALIPTLKGRVFDS